MFWVTTRTQVYFSEVVLPNQCAQKEKERRLTGSPAGCEFRVSLRLEEAAMIMYSSEQPIPTMPTKPRSSCHIYMALEHFQRWWLSCFPVQLECITTHWEEIFPNLQPAPNVLASRFFLGHVLGWRRCLTYGS